MSAALIVCMALGQAIASPAGASDPTGGVQSILTNFDSAGNQVIRFDVDGNAIDAHEGDISLFGDTYYLYGTSYGCGFREYRATPFCGFKVYSSPDLVHWTDQGTLFDASTPYWQQRCGGGGSTGGGCFRLQVVYDAHTNRYVLWFSAQDVGVGYHVLESTSPTGPFVERPAPQLAVNNDDVAGAAANGDETLFVDDDGTAYLVHSDWHRQGDQVVEQLDDSYESGTGRFVRLGLTHAEAPTMFKRNGRYYIMVSDPNCPFCAGTGSAYMTAPTPLGPWTGVDPNPPVYWSIQAGVLHANGGDAGFSIPGGDWTDYSFAFDTEPLTNTTDGRYAQSGWIFRAQNKGTPSGPATNGYLWSLSNDPALGPGGGSLVETVLQNGSAISRTIPLTFPVTAGQWYHVQTDVAGSVITTTIDGQVVDVRSDTTYTQGRAGFVESTARGEQALFRNVSVTAPDGTPLLTDLSQFDAPLPERTPINISANSCGGQPTHVAVIPGADGPIYLYQSDLWSGADTAGLANYYWAPLSFNADGSIVPITCEASSVLDLAVGTPGHQNVPADLDQTSGTDGFRASGCDMVGRTMHLQTFTPSRTGILSRLSLATFKSYYWTNAPFIIDVVTLDGDNRPVTTLSSQAVPIDSLNDSPREGVVSPDVGVVAGQHYGMLAHTLTTQGCYGPVYNDANPYPNGVEEVTLDGGSTWTIEPGRALKFSVSVSPGAPAATDTATAGSTPTAAPAPPTSTPTPAPPPPPAPTATFAPPPPLPTPTLPPPPPVVTPPSATVPAPAASPTPVPVVPPTATATPPGLVATPPPTPRAASSPSPSPAGTPTRLAPPAHPSATARPSQPPRPAGVPLRVAVAPARLAGSGWLAVRVRTAPGARVTLAFTIVEPCTRIVPKDAGWQRVYYALPFYRLTRRGQATSAGAWATRFHLTVAPSPTMQARLEVRVTMKRATRMARLTLLVVPRVKGRG